MTYNELLKMALAIVEKRRADAPDAGAARDFSIAITALEDALTRYNSGIYRWRGTWHRHDPEGDHAASG